MGASLNQRSGSTEITRGRVEKLRAAGRADASNQQHFAIGEQGGSVPCAWDMHVSDQRESSGGRVIQLSAGEQCASTILTAGNQNFAVREGGRCCTLADL